MSPVCTVQEAIMAGCAGKKHQQGAATEDQASLSQQGGEQTSRVAWPPTGGEKAPAPQEGYIPAREMKPWIGPVAQAALHAPAQRLPYVTLQTVSVRVKTDSGGYHVAKGIFDSGSALSYLSTKLRKAVKPRLLREEYIWYGTFRENCS